MARGQAGAVNAIREFGVVTFPREVFIRDVFDYRPGDHLTVLAPSGGGKTQLSLQLLGQVASPDLQAAILVMKPRDVTVDRFNRQYGFRVVRSWPPPNSIGRWVMNNRPPGYAVWPPELPDPDATEARQAQVFRTVMRDNYRAGGRTGKKHRDTITFGDELFSLEKELGLETEVRRMLTKGRSLGAGFWAASQRPVFISKWAYQAQHLFLGHDPDVDTQRRYGEIGGGIDPVLVRALTAGLKRYQYVYINREERELCIVDA